MADALIDDDVGHGTHVAGIIGGAMNGTLFHGVAPSVYIMPLAFLNSDLEDERDIPTASPYGGVQFAIAHGASIINNSWGTSQLLAFAECKSMLGGVCTSRVRLSGIHSSSV